MSMSEVEIVRIDVSARKASTVTDCVAQEKPLNILLDRTHYVTIFCSPSSLKELAIGHLLSGGIVKAMEEIKEIDLEGEGVCRVRLRSDIDLNRRLRLTKHFSRIILSACGTKTPYQPARRFAKMKSDLIVNAEVLLDSVKRLNLIAETFRKTGGVHVAAVFKQNGVLAALAEDIGRHNAVDKAIGAGALRQVDFAKCFLALSGRLTGDIVLKAACVGLPVIASLAAAIDSGIAVARKANLTLVGFVRGKRINVYSCAERVTL